MNHITNKLSILFGKFANKRFCKFTQSIINILYVKLLGLDMREFNSPTSYKTLNELFIRELVVKRDFNKTDSSIISPVDSIITDIGSINNNKAYQIKGHIDYIDRGAIFEDMKTWNGDRPGHAAAALRIEEVYSGSKKLI
jgi:phosphatidylserine decarboxylase